MSKAKAQKRSARDRIIETAERLFYAEGIRAVGIDRIIAEAEVAKMTLYNHFGSKDELILAVLEYRECKFDSFFKAAVARHADQGSGPLDAFFGALKDWFESPGFRGCAFINASVEIADASHPASVFAAGHKQRFQELIHSMLKEAGGKPATKLTPAVSLLVEGSIVTSLMQQNSHPADMAREATMALIGKPRRR